MADRPLLAGVEAGGTKVLAVLGYGPHDIVDQVRIPTTTPEATLGALLTFFSEQTAGGNIPAAAGIASFGPVELRKESPRYGQILTTPKPGWSNTDVLGPLRESLGVPIGFDTDVNGAALAEGRWGAARGLDTFVYLTIGTGIGGGAVVNGKIAHGMIHSEMGHIVVPHHPADAFTGRCPFHGDCLEGMAAGPAIEARWGQRAEHLTEGELKSATEMEAWYLAAGIRSLVYLLAPQRVILGGGVPKLPGLFGLVRSALIEMLGGYPGLPEHAAEDFIVPPGLGDLAGPGGALALAELALEEAG